MSAGKARVGRRRARGFPRARFGAACAFALTLGCSGDRAATDGAAGGAATGGAAGVALSSGGVGRGGTPSRGNAGTGDANAGGVAFLGGSGGTVSGDSASGATTLAGAPPTGANAGDGAGGVVTVAGGGGGANATGGTPGSASGSAGAGGSETAGVGGAGHANGGSGGVAIAAGSVPDLRFSGLVSAVELAPLRLAANGIYPAKITIASGGVDDLCGSSPKADIATNAETQFLRASATSGCEKVRVIFTVCEGLYRIVAKKSDGINALTDLAGKRVMAPSGASSAYFLAKMLASAGLTTGGGTGQVNVVSGNANGSTFGGGNAPDAATIWEPGIEQASEALGNDAVEFRTDASGKEVYRELFNLHTTTDVLADANKRKGVVALVRALIVASAELRDDPAVADALLAGPVGVSQAVLDKSLKYERYAGTLVSDLLDVMTEEEVWRAGIDNRSARSRDALAALIDTSVLGEAMNPP